MVALTMRSEEREEGRQRCAGVDEFQERRDVALPWIIPLEACLSERWACSKARQLGSVNGNNATARLGL